MGTDYKSALSVHKKLFHIRAIGFKDDMSGSDLDVSGSELDDHLESVGSEDEENNYNIGGDKHNNLDEVEQKNLKFKNKQL